jgi:Tol biopolymer transport system component
VALVAAGCSFTKRVSDPQAGATIGTYSRPALSGNARYVAYVAHTDSSRPGVTDGTYVLDTVTNQKELVSVASDGTPADSDTDNPAISADGRYVVFESDATNLVPNDTNDSTDVFLRDRTAHTTIRVSVDSNGAEADDASYEPSITADGRKVEFTSDSDYLDPEDSNGSSDIFVRDLSTGKTVLASRTAGVFTDFGAWDGVISADGNSVAFVTDTALSTNDINDSDDVYVRSLTQNKTTWVSKPRFAVPDGGGGDSPAISSDGRYVAFVSTAPDFDTLSTSALANVYRRDLVASTTIRVSTTPAGGALSAGSFQPSMNSTGSRVAFVSAGNPSGTDANGSVLDVFVKDLTKNKTALASGLPLGGQIPFSTTSPNLSADGRYVAYEAQGPIADDDTNGLTDVYLRALDQPTITSVSPTSVARGTNRTLTVTGTNFLPNAFLVLPAGVTATSTVVNGDTSMTVQITIASTATPGLASVVVENPGTGPGVDTGAIAKCDCLTIT